MYAYAYWSDYFGKTQVSLESLLQQQKTDLLLKAKKTGRTYSQQNKEEIESALNFFLPGQGQTSKLALQTGFSSNEIKQIEDAIKKKIESAIDTATGGINWGNLTGFSDAGNAAKIGGKIEKGGLRDELGNIGDWNRFESIQQRLQILTTGIQNLPVGEIQGDLASKLAILKNQWEQLQKTATITDKQFFKTKEKFIQTGKNSNFITELNNLMLSFKEKASSYITGQIGEMWAAASANLCKQVTEQALQDVNSVLQFINNSSMTGLVGKNQETHYIDSKNLSSLTYYKNGDQTINFTGMHGSGAKQGKIDFQLALPNSQTVNYDLSIKNYSDKTPHFTIHSGSSMIFLLQSYSNLLDYLINTAPRFNIPNDPNKTIDGPAADFMGITNLVKVSLIAQGLMGAYVTGENTITDKTADTFVVFRNGKYNVYFISDIIENLMNNINNLDKFGHVNNNNANSGLDLSNLKNTWVGPATERSRSYGLERTAALLAYLHQMKLEMTITVDALV